MSEKRNSILLILLAVIAAIALISAGCQSTAAAKGSSESPAAENASAEDNTAAEAAAGAELWADNCGRCHSLRDPSSYSAEEWQVTVQHMRVRVPLTGQQQRAITAFLAAR